MNKNGDKEKEDGTEKRKEKQAGEWKNVKRKAREKNKRKLRCEDMIEKENDDRKE